MQSINGIDYFGDHGESCTKKKKKRKRLGARGGKVLKKKKSKCKRVRERGGQQGKKWVAVFDQLGNRGEMVNALARRGDRRNWKDGEGGAERTAQLAARWEKGCSKERKKLIEKGEKKENCREKKNYQLVPPLVSV